MRPEEGVGASRRRQRWKTSPTHAAPDRAHQPGSSRIQNGAAVSKDIMRTLMIELAADRSTERTQEWVRGTWEQAKVWNDTELLAALTARLDLPDDLVSEASKRNEMPVRVAFLARPDRDVEFVRAALSAERRAGVLAGFYRTHPSPGAFSSVFERSLTEKPTLTLAEAVLETETLASGALTALTMATVLPRYETLTDNQRNATEKLLGAAAKEEVVADSILALIENLELGSKISRIILRTFGDHGLRSAQYVATLIAEGVDKPLADLRKHLDELARANQQPGYNARSLANVLSVGLSDARKFLDRAGFDSVAARIEAANLGEFSPLNDKDTRRVYSREEVIELFSRATMEDARELADVIEHDKVFLTEAAVTGALLDNPALGPVVDEHMPVFTGKEHEAIHRIVFAHRDGAFVARFFAFDAETLIEQYGLEPFADPATAWKQIARELALWEQRHALATDNYRGYYIRNAVQNFIDVCDDLDAIADLPWSTAEDVLGVTYWAERRAKVSQAIARAMELHIGADRNRWEAFITLSPGYTGSVNELAKLAAQL